MSTAASGNLTLVCTAAFSFVPAFCGLSLSVEHVGRFFPLSGGVRWPGARLGKMK